MMMKIKTAIVCLLLLVSCQKEKNQIYPTTLEEYVDEFFLQAKLRGQNIKVEDFNFSITFSDIIDRDAAATCNSNTDRIFIDADSWNRMDTQEREWLIFHELGHCLLDRRHRNERTHSGDCLSFMKGAENDFECSMNLYSDYWRSYYLDELFDLTHNLPNWYTESLDYNDIDQNYNNGF